MQVAEYIERREICEHFRQEPWPEGSSTEDREGRGFITAQLERYCTGTDQALRELKGKYRDNESVIERLEKYEADIEGKTMNHQILRLDIENDQALSDCFRVFRFLRPHLSEARFIEQVRAQAPEGYQIAYIEQEGEVVAATGYRVATFLAWGRVLYIDDLITHPESKRAGFGGALLDWLLAEGRRLGCEQVHLDTGHQRHDAHRLYLNKGFVLSSHHMSVKLT